MARGIVSWPDDLKRTLDLAVTADLAHSNFHAKGVFSEFPSATPKWTGRGVGGTESDFRETMARMFIQLEEKELQRFLTSVAAGAHDNGESKILASVLAGAGGKDRGTGYIDFLLQRASHAFQEKSQVIETLADNYVVYYFGAAAVPFTYSGTVLNTVEDDQAINMFRIYRDMIRGTQLARRRKLLRLRYNGMIVSGSVQNLNLDLDGDNEMSLSFSFQLLPKSILILPTPDFGIVVLKDAISDPSFNSHVDRHTHVVSAKPIAAPMNLLSGEIEEAEQIFENELDNRFGLTALINSDGGVGPGVTRAEPEPGEIAAIPAEPTDVVAGDTEPAPIRAPGAFAHKL